MHIAFIPDGNRRWVKKRGISIAEGYELGIRKVKDILEWCKEEKVNTVSFWAFSIDNFKRDKEEKNYLFGLFRKFLKDGLENIEKDKEVRILFSGRLNLFPKDTEQMMIDLMEKTSDRKPYTINIFIAYSGREEIIDAVNKIIDEQKKERLSIEDFNRYLYNELPDIDLIIRTSGEKRLSNFALWQSAYAEFYFSDLLWPELTKEEVKKAINDFRNRKRRFGK